MPLRPALGARLALPALALAIVAVSFSAIFIREADSGPAVIVWTRMALTLLLLAPLVARDVVTGRAPRTRRDWIEIGISGGCLAAHFLAWTASLRYTSVASSVLLVCTHPVLVALLGRRLLGEAVRPRLWVGIGLAMAGMAVTTAGDLRVSGSALGGDLLAVAGAVTVTGYILVGRRVSARYGAAGYSAPCYAVVAVVCLAVSPVGGGSPLPSARTLVACLGLAAVCTVLGHTVMNWSLRHLRATTVSLGLLGEPVITSLLAVPLLREAPSGSTLVGGAVILAGLAVAIAERPASVPTQLVSVAET